MKILRLFDSLKIVRTMFVAVACAFFIFPAKSDDCVATKIFQGEQYTEENRLEKKLMASNGTLSTNTNYYVTDYIPLKAGDYRFTIKDNGTGSRPVRLFLYDDDHNILAKPVSVDSTTSTNLRTFNFNVPTDCYARISARNTTTEKSLQPVNPITYTEPCIKIATTHYNETKFAPVEADLDAARTTINNLITQMQTNAVNVSKLAVEKQTRPNATCPAGKNCLLVMDPTGVENWYVIAGADDVETAPTTPDYFSFTVEPYATSYNNGWDNYHFAFGMTPSGTFTIDWGDGSEPQVVNRPTVTNSSDSASQYSHSYTTGGNKTIKITGRATGYSSSGPVIFFNDDETGNESFAFVMAIDGSLGAIFPTLGNGAGQQPRFSGTFGGTQITSIPAGLFSGVTGAMPYMFEGTFNSTRITSIPENLFSGVSGAAEAMFTDTFSGTQITSIPAGLFRGVTGAAPYMFSYTFQYTPITSIPENLFRGVTGAAEGMFMNTFSSAQITSIPTGLFSGITGAAPNMFERTFSNTPITSIPENLFRGVTGAEDGMFDSTFAYCPNLTGYIPESTFAGLIANNSPDVTRFMQNIFVDSTGMATTCPQNTTEVSTPYKSKYWSTGNGNAVMCRPNN